MRPGALMMIWLVWPERAAARGEFAALLPKPRASLPASSSAAAGAGAVAVVVSLPNEAPLLRLEMMLFTMVETCSQGQRRCDRRLWAALEVNVSC